MNCDLAFDCLTDPARRQCAELTEHLTRCPRCRDMAEALEPAIDLLSEVSSTETVSADAASFDNAGSLGEPAATSLEPRRQSSPLDGRLTAPVKSPGDPARPTAPWHTESHRRLQRRLVTWQLLAGIAGLACVLTAVTLLRQSDRQSLAALQVRAECQRATTTEASASTVVAGCVACHTLEESLQLIAESRRERVQTALTRCVACHVSQPAHATAYGEATNQAESGLPTLLACEFPQIGG
jgi:hypothetical protein